MVSAGLGVTIWPEHAPHLETVVARPIEGDRMRRKIQLRIVQGRRYSPALEAFVKLARVHDWNAAFPEPDHVDEIETRGQIRRMRSLEACAVSA